MARRSGGGAKKRKGGMKKRQGGFQGVRGIAVRQLMASKVKSPGVQVSGSAIIQRTKGQRRALLQKRALTSSVLSSPGGINATKVGEALQEEALARGNVIMPAGFANTSIQKNIGNTPSVQNRIGAGMVGLIQNLTKGA
jgi:hypothetical protein